MCSRGLLQVASGIRIVCLESQRYHHQSKCPGMTEHQWPIVMSTQSSMVFLQRGFLFVAMGIGAMLMVSRFGAKYQHTHEKLVVHIHEDVFAHRLNMLSEAGYRMVGHLSSIQILLCLTGAVPYSPCSDLCPERLAGCLGCQRSVVQSCSPMSPFKYLEITDIGMSQRSITAW